MLVVFFYYISRKYGLFVFRLGNIFPSLLRFGVCLLLEENVLFICLAMQRFFLLLL